MWCVQYVSQTLCKAYAMRVQSICKWLDTFLITIVWALNCFVSNIFVKWPRKGCLTLFSPRGNISLYELAHLNSQKNLLLEMLNKNSASLGAAHTPATLPLCQREKKSGFPRPRSNRPSRSERPKRSIRFYPSWLGILLWFIELDCCSFPNLS